MVEPSAPENVPAGHSTHVVAGAYVPAAQAWHAVAPGLENWPAGQGVQAVAPAAAAKLPAGHMAQLVADIAYMPAAQVPEPPAPPVLPAPG